jgi:hypothetical protein
MVTLCCCVTMCHEQLHGHPKAKGDHATHPLISDPLTCLLDRMSS